LYCKLIQYWCIAAKFIHTPFVLLFGVLGWRLLLVPAHFSSFKLVAHTTKFSYKFHIICWFIMAAIVSILVSHLVYWWQCASAKKFNAGDENAIETFHMNVRCFRWYCCCCTLVTSFFVCILFDFFVFLQRQLVQIGTNLCKRL
jgi:hypothetical protein